MFENIMKFFKKGNKKVEVPASSKDAAKERLHLVLMQDRANVSADFLELMKQEIIDVIKKYIEVDETAIDVRLTNKENDDGTNGAPALYANIPIINIKNETIVEVNKNNQKDDDKIKKEEKKEEPKEEKEEIEKVKEAKVIIDSSENDETKSKEEIKETEKKEETEVKT